MEIIILIVWLGGSILVAIDAKKNQVTTSDKPYSVNNGAFAWLFFCLIPIGFPLAYIYYLIRRRKIVRLRDE